MHPERDTPAHNCVKHPMLQVNVWKGFYVDDGSILLVREAFLCFTQSQKVGHRLLFLTLFQMTETKYLVTDAAVIVAISV